MSDIRPTSSPDNAEAMPEPAGALIAHIQHAAEQQKSILARELHDELGGLLVGAVMDVAWAEQHADASSTELKQKLLRARQTLSAAIDLKRRLIEELRPTLLDNVGLFAALRWHIQSTCKHADLKCTIEMPEEERRFLPNIPISLFRIVQEAFALIVAKPPAASAEFKVIVNPTTLSLSMSRRHQELATLGAPSASDLHSLSAIKHRTELLSGDFTHTDSPPIGTNFTATFPLEKLVA
jgi:signal transduction histidine kinase